MDSPTVSSSPVIHPRPTLPEKKGWKVFLSHAQDKGGNQIFVLREALYASSLYLFQHLYNKGHDGRDDENDGWDNDTDNQEYAPLTIWNDQDEEATFPNMEYGIKHSSYILLYMTNGMLLRPAVQFEIHCALKYNKPIIFITDGIPVNSSLPVPSKPTNNTSFESSHRKVVPLSDGSTRIIQTTTSITIVPSPSQDHSSSHIRPVPSSIPHTSDPSPSSSTHFSIIDFQDVLTEGEKFSNDPDNFQQGFVYLTPQDFTKLRAIYTEQGGITNVIKFYPDYDRLFGITIEQIRKALRLPALHSILRQTIPSVATDSDGRTTINSSNSSSVHFRMRRPLPPPSPLRVPSRSPSSSSGTLPIVRESLGPTDLLIFSSPSVHGLCQATFLRITFMYRCNRRSLVIRNISDNDNYTKSEIEGLIDSTNSILFILTNDVWRSSTILTAVHRLQMLTKTVNNNRNLSRYGFIFESDSRYGGEHMSSIMEYCPKDLKEVFSTYLAIRFERKKQQRETFIKELLVNRIGVVPDNDSGGTCRAPVLPLGYQELPVRNLVDNLYRELVRDSCLIVAMGGWGGVGKTTIATAIAHDKRINSYFDDVFWLSIGQIRNRRYLFNKLLLLYRELQHCAGSSVSTNTNGSEVTNEPPTIESTATEIAQYLNNRASLIIIDDCWYSLQFLVFLGILHPDSLRNNLLIGGANTTNVSLSSVPRKRSKLLFTTRFIKKFEEAVNKSHLHYHISSFVPPTGTATVLSQVPTGIPSTVSAPLNMNRRSLYTTFEMDKLDDSSAVWMLVEKAGLFPSVDKYTLVNDTRVRSLLYPILAMIGKLPFSLNLMGAYFRTKLERIWNTNPMIEEQILKECMKELMYYKRLETEPHLTVEFYDTRIPHGPTGVPLRHRIGHRSMETVLSTDLIFARLDQLSLRSTHEIIRSPSVPILRSSSGYQSDSFHHRLLNRNSSSNFYGEWLSNPIFRTALEVQNNEWVQYIQSYQAIQLTLAAIFTSYDIIHFAMFGLFNDDTLLHYSILRTCWNTNDESAKRLLYRLSDAGILKLDDHGNNELYVMLHDLALDFARALCCIVRHLDTSGIGLDNESEEGSAPSTDTDTFPYASGRLRVTERWKTDYSVDHSFHALHRYLLVRLATSSIPSYSSKDDIVLHFAGQMYGNENTTKESSDDENILSTSSTPRMIVDYDGLTEEEQYFTTVNHASSVSPTKVHEMKFHVRPWWKIDTESPIGRYIVHNLWSHLYRANLIHEIKYLATHFDWLRMYINSIGYSSFLIEYYRYVLANADENKGVTKDESSFRVKEPNGDTNSENIENSAYSASSVPYGLRPHPYVMTGSDSIPVHSNDNNGGNDLPSFYGLYYKALKLCTVLNLSSSSVIKNGLNLALQLLGRLIRYKGFYPTELDPLLLACEHYCRKYHYAIPTKLYLTHPGSLIDSLLSGHTKQVWCVEICNKDYLASGSEDNTIRVWNLHTGELDKILEGHTNSVTFLRKLSSERLLSASNDGSIRVWNIYSGIQEYVNNESNSPITSLTIHKYNPSIILIGRFDGTVQIVSLSLFTTDSEETVPNVRTTDSVNRSNTSHSDTVNESDTDNLSTDIFTLSSSFIIEKKDRLITNSLFLYDDLQLGEVSRKYSTATNTEDRSNGNKTDHVSTFRIIISTGKSVFLPFIEEEMNKTSNRSKYATSSNTSLPVIPYTVDLWRITHNSYNNNLSILKEHSWSFDSSIASIVEVPEACIAIGLGDNRILITETKASFNIRQELLKHSKGVSVLYYSPIDKLLLSGSQDVTICVWRIKPASEDNETDSYLQRNFGCGLLTLTNDEGNEILPIPSTKSSGTGDTVLVHKPWEWEYLNHFTTYHKVYINCIRRLPDGRYVTSGGVRNSQLSVWNIYTAKSATDCDHRLDKHTSGITAVTMDQDGRIASSGKDRLVVVWYVPPNRTRVARNPSIGDHETVATLRKFPLIERHTRSITAMLLFSVDQLRLSFYATNSNDNDYRILTSSWDRRVHIWDSFTGKRLSTIQHDRAYISKLVWLNPEFLILGGDYGEIVLWYLPYDTKYRGTNVPNDGFVPYGSGTVPEGMIEREHGTSLNGAGSMPQRDNPSTTNALSPFVSTYPINSTISNTDIPFRTFLHRTGSDLSTMSSINSNTANNTVGFPSDSSVSSMGRPIPLTIFPYASTNNDGTKNIWTIRYPSVIQPFCNPSEDSSVSTLQNTRIERYQVLALVGIYNRKTQEYDTTVHVWNTFVYPEVRKPYQFPASSTTNNSPSEETPSDTLPSSTPPGDTDGINNTNPVNTNNDGLVNTVTSSNTVTAGVPTIITEYASLRTPKNDITDMIHVHGNASSSSLSMDPYLVTASMDGTVQFWDIYSLMDTANIPSPFTVPASPVPVVPVSSTKDTNEADVSQEYHKHSPAYVPANQYSLTRSTDNSASAVQIRFIGKGHNGPVRKVLSLHKDCLIISCSDDSTIKMWENPLYRKNSPPSLFSPSSSEPLSVTCLDTLEGHKASVMLLTLVPDLPTIVMNTATQQSHNYTLLSVCKTHVIRLWQISVKENDDASLSVSSSFIRQFTGHEAEVRCLIGFRIPKVSLSSSLSTLSLHRQTSDNSYTSDAKRKAGHFGSSSSTNNNKTTDNDDDDEQDGRRGGTTSSDRDTIDTGSDRDTIDTGSDRDTILLIGSASKDKKFRLWDGTVSLSWNKDDENGDDDNEEYPLEKNPSSLSRSGSAVGTIDTETTATARQMKLRQHTENDPYCLCTVQFDDSTTCLEYIPASKRIAVGTENGTVGFFDIQPVLDSFF